MTNNMLQTAAYPLHPFIFTGVLADTEAYRAQSLQQQIRAFITGEGHLSPVYSRIPEWAMDELCAAVTTLTGKSYEPSRDGLVEGWNDLEQLVLAWQSPYGQGWKAQPAGA